MSRGASNRKLKPLVIDTPAHGNLLANVVDFGTQLRQRGLLVTPSESIDSLRALRHVDIADFALLSGTFNLNSGQTGFLAYFDFNNDGHIDIADFGQFSIRLFTPLP